MPPILIRIFNVLLAKGNKSKIAENILSKRFYSWYVKYNKAKQSIGKLQNPNIAIFNSANWVKILKLIPKTELVQLEKTIKKIEWQTVTRSYYRLDKDSYNNKISELNDEMNQRSKWIRLSSSWLNQGRWTPTAKNKLLGTLQVTTLTGGATYTYPLVPYEIWVNMKQQVGRNGSGAGTIFWRYWLRIWYPSALRKKISNDLKNKRITKEFHDDIVREFVEKRAKQFVTNKRYQNYWNQQPNSLNKMWYQNRANTTKSQRLKDIRNYLKYNSRYIQYKNVRQKYKEIYIFKNVTKKKTNAYGKFVKKYKQSTIGKTQKAIYRPTKNNAKSIYGSYIKNNKKKRG